MSAALIKLMNDDDSDAVAHQLFGDIVAGDGAIDCLMLTA